MPAKERDPIIDVQERRAAEARQLRIDYAQTFGPSYGKTVLYDLAERFHLFTVNATTDPIQMAFQEGQRSVVVHILAILSEADPAEYRKQMLKEVVYG